VTDDPDDTAKTSIRLSRATWRDLKKEAVTTGRTLTEIVEERLAESFRRRPPVTGTR